MKEAAGPNANAISCVEWRNCHFCDCESVCPLFPGVSRFKDGVLIALKAQLVKRWTRPVEGEGRLSVKSRIMSLC